MDKVVQLMRVIASAMVLSGLIAALPVANVVSSQETSLTGSLEITLADESGVPLAGSCYAVTDAAGASFSVCDDDGDGVAYVEGLAAGDALVV